jgi:hypothetical protein
MDQRNYMMKSKPLSTAACSAPLLVASSALAQQNAPAQAGPLPNSACLREMDGDRIIQIWIVSAARAENMNPHSPAGQLRTVRECKQ